MKRAKLMVVGLAMLWTQLGAAPAEPAKKVKLFILSGQSNAGGAGIGCELPAELKRTDAEVLMSGRHAHKDLVPVGPYKRDGYGQDNTAFGAEIVFGKEMKKAYPDCVICIAKQTTGNCSIIAWDKNWKREGWLKELKQVDNEEKGTQYEFLMSTVKDAVAALREKGLKDIEYAGMLWVQSERDDKSEETAKAYGANLRALIANVRSDLATPGMPFLFADANAHRYRDILREGMRKVAAEVPRTAVIPIDDLPKHKAVHYNTQGQIMLGQRFADAYLKIVGKATPPAASATP
jgi:hypothetical protein